MTKPPVESRRRKSFAAWALAGASVLMFMTSSLYGGKAYDDYEAAQPHRADPSVVAAICGQIALKRGTGCSSQEKEQLISEFSTPQNKSLEHDAIVDLGIGILDVLGGVGMGVGALLLMGKRNEEAAPAAPAPAEE